MFPLQVNLGQASGKDVHKHTTTLTTPHTMEANEKRSSSPAVAEEGVTMSTLGRPKPLPRLATAGSPAQQGVQQSWLVSTEVVHVLTVWSEDCVQTEADNPLTVL